LEAGVLDSATRALNASVGYIVPWMEVNQFELDGPRFSMPPDVGFNCNITERPTRTDNMNSIVSPTLFGGLDALEFHREPG
jgi:hypothetical protein